MWERLYSLQAYDIRCTVSSDVLSAELIIQIHKRWRINAWQKLHW